MTPTGSTDPAPPSLARAARVAAVTALAYAVVGVAALLLAGPPGYAAPVFPSAGIALAAALVYGRAAWAGIWLGSCVINAGLGLLRAPQGEFTAWLPAWIGMGALLQAAVGAWVVRRVSGTWVTLDELRPIVRAGLLGGLLCSAISACVATPALVLAGAVPPAEALENAFTWWVGDALGALIVTPVLLAFIGQPADDWRPRRRTLALPLALALGLLSLGVWQADRVLTERAQLRFQTEVDRLAALARTRLDESLLALRALESAAGAADGLDPGSLRAAAAPWLTRPSALLAMGYAEPPGASAEASAVGAWQHVGPDPGGRAAPSPVGWPDAAMHRALETSRTQGRPVAASVDGPGGPATAATGVIVLQALRGDSTLPAQPAAAVFVSLDPARLLMGLVAPGSGLSWCVVDGGASAGRTHWAGPPGCERHAAAATGIEGRRPLPFAGRALELQVWAEAGTPAARDGQSAWLLAVAGLAGLALLGALLLVATGHASRTRRAVLSSTEQLRLQVAERLQTEAALRESGQRLRSILNAVPLGVLFMDTRGYLLECNPRLSEMTGWPDERLLGSAVVDLLHPDDVAAVRQRRIELLQQGAARVEQVARLRRPDGSEIAVRITASALRDAAGRAVRMVGVLEDITERQRLEASESALRRAEAENRAKSDFLSRMSHELRTPLNAMIGFAQLLGLDRDPALTPRQGEWAGQIQRAGWHLLELINETLDLARIESGAVQLALVPVDLPAMASASSALVAAAAGQQGVSLHEELSPDAPSVMADATRLRQVLTNLLSNGIKYNRPGGRVTLRTRPGDAGRVAIEVADTGIGMSPAQLQQLFQPYNRLGREASGIEGTGIGLVISQRLAELMGGDITVSSQEGQGSTFTLWLPAAPAAQWAQPQPDDIAQAPYRRRVVHYVEDNPTNVEVMRGVLAQRPQVSLGVSTLGLDGLTAIRRDQPDLVLLDMQLPDISGLELLRHLKQDERVAAIPVIVVSADATPAHVEQALTQGAHHYVTKPLDIAAFLALVDETLESAETRF